MFTIQFWKDALERLVKAAAGGLVVGLTAAQSATASAVDWASVGWSTLIAAGISLCLSIASAPFGAPGTASVQAAPTPPASTGGPPPTS